VFVFGVGGAASAGTTMAALKPVQREQILTAPLWVKTGPEGRLTGLVGTDRGDKLILSGDTTVRVAKASHERGAGELELSDLEGELVAQCASVARLSVELPGAVLAAPRSAFWVSVKAGRVDLRIRAGRASLNPSSGQAQELDPGDQATWSPDAGPAVKRAARR
jgi:ferric-dicitrate binding protein FerR (iron transport regulator)